MNKYVKPYYILPILILVVFWRWLSFKIIAYSDYVYYPLRTVKTWTTPSTWSSSLFGSPDINFWRMPYDYIFGAAAQIGLPYNVSDKLFLFLPYVIASVLCPYLLIYALVKKQYAATIGALLFALNSYFLAINTQGHIKLSFAGSLVMLALWLLISGLKSLRTSYFIYLALLSLVICVIDVRIYYILLGLISLYSLYHLLLIRKSDSSVIKHALLNLITTFALSLALNAFWLTNLFSITLSPSNRVLGRGLFGDQYWNLESSLALFHPFWNGSKPIWFMINPVPLIFWSLPIFAILGFLINLRNKNAAFFLFIALLGVMLSKQSDIPMPGLYKWLFDYIPGFSAFREASKFYLLTAIGYSVLISYFIATLGDTFYGRKFTEKYKIEPGVIVSSVPILLAVTLAIPMITGSIQSTFTGRSMPADYKVLNNYLANDKGYFRTLWVPRDSIWANNTNDKPKSNALDLAESGIINFWGPLHNNSIDQKQVEDVFTQSYSEAVLSGLSVKYVIVPIRDLKNDSDIFQYYGNNRQFYINLLDKQPYLDRQNIGTSQIVVYRNKSFNDHASTATTVVDYQKPGNLDLENDFRVISPLFKNQPLVFLENNKKTVPTNNVMNLLDSTITTWQDSVASISPRPAYDNASKILLRDNLALGQYSIKSGVLKIVKSPMPTLDEQTAYDMAQINNILNPVEERLSSGFDYYISNDKTLWKIDTTDTILHNLGSLNNSTLYKTNGVNIFKNGDFSDGIWPGGVRDCNNYDDNPRISGRLIDQKGSNFPRSLELSAIRHTACVYSEGQNVQAGKDYRFSFSYKTDSAKRVGYEIRFDNDKSTSISEDVYQINNEWRNYSRVIKSPANTHKVTIILKAYPDDRRQMLADTSFSNVALNELENIAPLVQPSTPEFSQKAITTSNKITFNYPKNEDYTSNLISNGSLENGLWKSKVGDCNAFDTTPNIKQKLGNDNAGSSSKYLQFDVVRHTACTGPSPVKVIERAEYSFSFKYQSPSGSDAGYDLQFDDPDHTEIHSQVTTPASNAKWSTYTINFTAPFGATHVNILLYGYSSELGYTTVITRYDDLTIHRVPELLKNSYLLAETATVLNKPRRITETRVRNDKSTISINGASTPFYLLLSESYDSGWSLKVSKLAQNNQSSKTSSMTEKIPENYHIKINDLENGWYIDTTEICKHQNLCSKDADGNYNFQLVAEFTPQRWFNIGMVISGTTLVACVGYLGYDFVRTRRRRQVVPIGYAPVHPAIGRSYVKTQKHPLLHRRKNRVYKLRQK